VFRIAARENPINPPVAGRDIALRYAPRTSRATVIEAALPVALARGEIALHVRARLRKRSRSGHAERNQMEAIPNDPPQLSVGSVFSASVNFAEYPSHFVATLQGRGSSVVSP
jgi:hypothetical protein